MSPEEFCAWLKGFFEGSGGNAPSSNIIKQKLDSVLTIEQKLTQSRQYLSGDLADPLQPCRHIEDHDAPGTCLLCDEPLSTSLTPPSS